MSPTSLLLENLTVNKKNLSKAKGKMDNTGNLIQPRLSIKKPLHNFHHAGTCGKLLLLELYVKICFITDVERSSQHYKDCLWTKRLGDRAAPKPSFLSLKTFYGQLILSCSIRQHNFI